MGDLIKVFTSFDKMVGTSIIKVLYFVVAGLIILVTIGGMFTALMNIGNSFIGSISGLIMTPIFGLIGLLFWRFMCEIYILFFKISDDLSAIRISNEKTD